MGLLDKVLAPWRGEKAISASQMRHPTHGALTLFDMPSTNATLAEMEAEVGDGTESDVLMTPIRWLWGALVEAPLIVGDEDDAPVDGSLADLLETPNAFYSMEHLLAATTMDLCVHGNGYWLPVGRRGEPDTLWYAPYSTIKPVASGNRSFIDYYRYTVGGTSQKLDPEDVIHFRDGIDPRDIRLGLSSLRSLLRRVWTDDEAARFTGQMLSNGGMPGIVVAPSGDLPELSQNASEAIQAQIDSTTRSGRGRTVVLSGPATVESFGWSPRELDLSPLGDITEERVCAALGVPAAIVGFGSGLQQTKVGATMHELRKLAHWNGVAPRQRIIASELSRYFGANVLFDTRDVPALSEDRDAVVARCERLVRAGIWTRSRAKEELGEKPELGDDVYLLSIATVAVPAGELPKPPEPPHPPEPVVQEPAPDPEADPEKGLKHHASLIEARIIQTARRVTSPPEPLVRAAAAMDRARKRAEEIMAPPLTALFQDLRVQADLAIGRALGGKSLKQEGAELAELILGDMDVDAAQARLTQILSESYAATTRLTTTGLSNALGVVIEVTDAQQVAVLQAGGLRAGLIDLTEGARTSIFEALASGREMGLAGNGLARHILGSVTEGDGPWSLTRARMIARTEGAHAANTSSLVAARSMGVEMAMVHDNRTGFDDDVCSAIDGTVVTLAEAEALGLAHPNCTRSFTPIPALLAEEMGL